MLFRVSTTNNRITGMADKCGVWCCTAGITGSSLVATFSSNGRARAAASAAEPDDFEEVAAAASAAAAAGPTAATPSALNSTEIALVRSLAGMLAAQAVNNSRNGNGTQGAWRNVCPTAGDAAAVRVDFISAS